MFESISFQNIAGDWCCPLVSQRFSMKVLPCFFENNSNTWLWIFLQKCMNDVVIHFLSICSVFRSSRSHHKKRAASPTNEDDYDDVDSRSSARKKKRQHRSPEPTPSSRTGDRDRKQPREDSYSHSSSRRSEKEKGREREKERSGSKRGGLDKVVEEKVEKLAKELSEDELENQRKQLMKELGIIVWTFCASLFLSFGVYFKEGDFSCVLLHYILCLWWTNVFVSSICDRLLLFLHTWNSRTIFSYFDSFLLENFHVRLSGKRFRMWILSQFLFSFLWKLMVLLV